jgi:hypothetical protein
MTLESIPDSGKETVAFSITASAAGGMRDFA